MSRDVCVLQYTYMIRVNYSMHEPLSAYPYVFMYMLILSDPVSCTNESTPLFIHPLLCV